MNIWNEFVLYVSITKKDGTKNFYHVRLWSCIYDGDVFWSQGKSGL